MNTWPEHGGNLEWASRTFDIAMEDWLDLSTGISPWAWPVEAWPNAVFERLPPACMAPLHKIAADYYACQSGAITAVPGSQYAISTLPRLLTLSCVAVPQWGYQEHAKAWQSAGHHLRRYGDNNELVKLIECGSVQHVVFINPNNPSAQISSQKSVLAIYQRLQRQTAGSGLMLVDEAFMDITPDQSVASCELKNLMVLRSFGKFFGLAGVRLGFVIHSGPWLTPLRQQMGPWLIGHPAYWVAQRALADNKWAQHQRQRIQSSAARLQQLLQHYLPLHPWLNGGLFVSCRAPAMQLKRVFHGLAEQGILVRYDQLDSQQAWLRIGLSACWLRLTAALQKLPVSLCVAQI